MTQKKKCVEEDNRESRKIQSWEHWKRPENRLLIPKNWEFLNWVRDDETYGLEKAPSSAVWIKDKKPRERTAAGKVT